MNVKFHQFCLKTKIDDQMGRSSIACWISEAMPEFCNHDAHLIVIAKAIILEEAAVIPVCACYDILVTTQPSSGKP